MATTVPMTNLAPNWAGVTYHEGILPTKSHEPWIRWSHVKKQKTYLDYHNAYGHKTLQEASIHNVTWPYTQAVLQDRVTMDIIVYPLSQCLRLLCICTSDKWWLTMRSFHPQNYTTLWTRSHVRPNDKSKASPLTQCLGPKIISAFIKTLEIKLLPLPAVKLFTLGMNLANQVWYS